MQDQALQLLWLQLLQWPKVSRKQLLKLLSKTEPKDIPSLSNQQLSVFGLSELAINARESHFANSEHFESQLAILAAQQADIVAITDARYPPLLAEIPDPPVALFVAGDIALLHRPQIAIVGGRKASKAGIDTAFAFAKDLAASGLGICSGLALGIDAASHEGALAANGATVAVIGTGIDQRYPRSNQQLHRKIVEKGCVVTEFPPGFGVRRESFPQRNRIISGLSLGTLVVEASLRSGSLITARLALEQGREVYAIPGSIHNPMARGCHQLIRQGASLVETSNHIMEELEGWLFPSAQQSLLPNTGAVEHRGEQVLSLEEQQLLEHIPYSPVIVDVLLAESGLNIALVQVLLSSLEMKGKIEQIAGNWQRCS